MTDSTHSGPNPFTQAYNGDQRGRRRLFWRRYRTGIVVFSQTRDWDGDIWWQRSIGHGFPGHTSPTFATEGVGTS
jgi:hypothetical protein